MKNLPEKVVEFMRGKGWTCAVAESCTGGGVGAAITSVAGASEVFAGGVISYSNAVKRDVLGVPVGILDAHGAVSGECAAAMAEGVRKVMNVDVAVSVTGIAGPGGGSAAKPVGLVWFGVAFKGKTFTERCVFGGDRAQIRKQAVDKALSLLWVEDA